MRICYIANANNIHTRRWVEPIARVHDVHLISVRPIKEEYHNITKVDLTRITNARMIRFLIWGLWLRRYLGKIQPDLIHAHQIPGPGWIGAISDYHPLIVSSWGSDLLVEPGKSRLRKSLVNIVLSRCDALTVPNTYMQMKAHSLGVDPEKLALIPWGVETKIFKPIPKDRDATRRKFNIPNHSKVVLSPRRITPLYNIDIVISAIRIAKEYIQDLYLVILEYTPEEKYLRELRKLVVDSRLEGKVIWVPPQNNLEEMARLYRMSDVVVSIPSSEGYGFTPLEAMACGAPTLVSDLPTYENDLVDEINTIKVHPRDFKQTSKAIVKLLSDEKLRINIIKSGMEVVQNHKITTRVSKTLKLYEKLMDQSIE